MLHKTRKAADRVPNSTRALVRVARATFEPTETFVDIAREAGFAILTVAGDVHPDRDLLLDDFLDGASHAHCKLFLVIGLAVFLARMRSMRPGGRTKLPTWVVRIRSVLRFMVSLPVVCKLRTPIGQGALADGAKVDVVRLMTIPISAFVAAPKLVYGALFRPPDKVAKAPYIAGDITRQHDQVWAWLGKFTEGVDPFF